VLSRVRRNLRPLHVYTRDRTPPALAVAEVTDTEYAGERMSASRLCADAQLAESALKGAG
jgi:hypothetical protein